MKASKFTDAQNAFIVRQYEDDTPVAAMCRKAGISQRARREIATIEPQAARHRP